MDLRCSILTYDGVDGGGVGAQKEADQALLVGLTESGLRDLVVVRHVDGLYALLQCSEVVEEVLSVRSRKYGW